MCHDWWFERRYSERESSSELWEDFEQTQPLSDPEVRDEDAEVKLEQPSSTPVAAEH